MSVGAPGLTVVLGRLTEPLRLPTLDLRRRFRVPVCAWKRVRRVQFLVGRACYALSFVLVRGRTRFIVGAAPGKGSRRHLKIRLLRS